MHFKPHRFVTLRLALLALLLNVIQAGPLSAENALVSGPMLGHIEMREASVWVQTAQPAVVRVAYRAVPDANQGYWSAPVQSTLESGNTAVLFLPEVEPGQTYRYEIEIDGALSGEAYSFTTPAFYHDKAPPPDLRIAVGGAHYAVQEGFEPPYKILGGGYDIFTTILKTKPDLMLWVGNTAHLRESDWTSKSGYLKRFTHARSLPQLQPLLAAVPHYATWGEADYAAGSAGAHYAFRSIAEDSFRAFWPQPVKIPGIEGITTRFRRSDVDFFLLDVRSHRNDTPNPDELPQMLGRSQIEWLRQELIRSTATFKIIVAGAPILNPAKTPGNMSSMGAEHSHLLEMLRAEQIPGLIFISGGKYYGELTRLVHANSYNLHDLTVGPLTANPKANEDELNFFRMPGTSAFSRHFALLEVTGPEEERQLTMRVLGADGEELWSRTLNASQLTSRRD